MWYTLSHTVTIKNNKYMPLTVIEQHEYFKRALILWDA